MLPPEETPRHPPVRHYGLSTRNSGSHSPLFSSPVALDPKVIAAGFANDGQDVPAAGQVASITSTNNFINFCLTSTLPLTNGKQVQDGSCNPAPMGLIPSVRNMPSSKFVFPVNQQVVGEKTPFTIKMAIKNLETGNFVNAQQNYFSAPQQLNAAGNVRGHSHVVIELVDSLTSTTPLDVTKFAFFKVKLFSVVATQRTVLITDS